MGIAEYRASQRLSYHAHEEAFANAFYSLLMAAIREADTESFEKLEAAFSDVVAEFRARYHAPGGLLKGEK